MKPDVIVCWPRNCDYPLWRRFIVAQRWRFGRVFVVFTKHDGRDLSPWVREHLPYVEFIDGPDGPDWRDAAVNAALDRSDAEWVWFTEQDFTIGDAAGFWRGVEYFAGFPNVRAMGYREDVRWHPACLLVRRSAIDATRRYFGPDPVDHFYSFGEDLGEVFDLGVIFRIAGCEHMAGLSQNHWLISQGDPNIYRSDRFFRYLWECLMSSIALEPGWAEEAERELAK